MAAALAKKPRRDSSHVRALGFGKRLITQECRRFPKILQYHKSATERERVGETLDQRRLLLQRISQIIIAITLVKNSAED